MQECALDPAGATHGNPWCTILPPARLLLCRRSPTHARLRRRAHGNPPRVSTGQRRPPAQMTDITRRRAIRHLAALAAAPLAASCGVDRLLGPALGLSSLASAPVRLIGGG